MTAQQAGKVVLMLLTAWPNAKVERRSAQLYEAVIQPLDFEAAQAVVMELISTCEDPFLPRPATIRRLVMERCRALDGRAVLTAEEAWLLVQARIQNGGYYTGGVFAEPSIQRAVTAIGWGELCHNPNVEATRGHFLRFYNSYRERELKEEMLTLGGPADVSALPDLRNES